MSADDILDVFDKQERAFADLTTAVAMLHRDMTSLPARIAQKTAADTTEAVRKGNEGLLQQLTRRERLDAMAAERAARGATLMRWLPWGLGAALILAVIVEPFVLFKPMSRSDTLCGWMGGMVTTATNGAKGCMVWR